MNATVSLARKVHHGPIHSAVAGRTDHLPMHVPEGAYVIPADIISGMGEGNSVAGFKIAKNLFTQPFYNMRKATSKSLPYADGMPYGVPAVGRKSGGEVGDEGGKAIPIVAAGGEHVIHPKHVAAIGEGSLEDGHRILDEFVKQYRQHLIATLKKLPGPQKN